MSSKFAADTWQMQKLLEFACIFSSETATSWNSHWRLYLVPTPTCICRLDEETPTGIHRGNLRYCESVKYEKDV